MHLSIFTCNAEVSLVQPISPPRTPAEGTGKPVLQRADAGPGRGHSQGAGGARPAGHGADRQRQDRGLPAAAAAPPAGRGQAALPGARADPPADPRAGPADPQGSRALRPVHLHQGLPDHWRRGLQGAGRAPAQEPGDHHRHPRPPARAAQRRQPAVAGHRGAGAGRGRPHARHGLRRRRAGPGQCLPGRAPDPAVLRHPQRRRVEQGDRRGAARAASAAPEPGRRAERERPPAGHHRRRRGAQGTVAAMAAEQRDLHQGHRLHQYPGLRRSPDRAADRQPAQGLCPAWREGPEGPQAGHRAPEAGRGEDPRRHRRRRTRPGRRRPGPGDQLRHAAQRRRVRAPHRAAPVAPAPRAWRSR